MILLTTRQLGSTLLLLTFAGCRGLQPLPPPRALPALSATDPTTFWREVEAGNPLPAASESAWRSTTRMIWGDLSTKRKAQRQATACRSEPPAGFEALEGVAVERAPPLFAYLARGRADRPIVLVLHGLYDSRNSLYVRRTASWLAGQGFGVLVPDLRWHGCLLSQEWLPTLGFEEARDLVGWGRWLRQREPGREVGLLGFSLGALDAIHALAADEAAEVFRAGGIAVSPPAELARTFTAFDRGTRAADRGLLRLLDRGFRDFLVTRIRDQKIAMGPAAAERPFEAMLDHVIRQRFAALGVTRERLFAITDPAPRVHAAKRPLLLLPATNDPFFGELTAAALGRAAGGNPLVRVLETPYGGHIGQLGLYPQWMVDLVARFFAGSAAVEPH